MKLVFILQFAARRSLLQKQRKESIFPFSASVNVKMQIAVLNALAKACPFDLDHSVVVLCSLGLCLRAPGRGESGFRGGPCPGFIGFLLASSDPGS